MSPVRSLLLLTLNQLASAGLSDDSSSHSHSPVALTHPLQVLRKLVLPDGTILRARLPGRPTRDSLFADPARDGKSLLKVRAGRGRWVGE